MSFSASTLRTSLVALSHLTAAACGSSPPPTTSGAPVLEAPSSPAHARGGRVASAVIGPSGGVLELSNGAKFVIPEGALTDAVEVTLNVSSASMAFNNREGEQPLGPVLMVQPAFAATSGTFTLTVPVSGIPAGAEGNALVIAVEQPAEQQSQFEEAAVRTIWSYEPATVSNGRLEARMSTIYGYRLQFLYSP